VIQAKMDATHELNYLASQVVVDQHFVEALHILHKQFGVFIKFFDSKHVWQVNEIYF